MIHCILSIDLSFLNNDAIIALSSYLLLYITYYFSNEFKPIKKVNKSFNEPIGSLLRSQKNIELWYYPEVRKEKWTNKDLVINSSFWFIYILGYEFAIRGMLFFACLYEYGLLPAIFINSDIYSLIHVFKGSKETYGAFFLGIIFCLIT